jgi:MarR family 2-MHQ and catechol resistance regulon transcriptional repressor
MEQKTTIMKSLGGLAIEALNRTSKTLLSEMYSNLVPYKLTLSQYGILEALYRNGPMFQTELASQTIKTAGNITTVIDNLEKGKLVERKRGEDRRYYKIYLTPKGRRLIKKVYPLRSTHDDVVK